MDKHISEENQYEDGQYEERADYITEEDILKWNVEIPFFIEIQKRLIDKGSKVLVGPRGTGKTHQMKIAYKSCFDDDRKPLPIYVSFNMYYHLEPLLYKNPAAIKVFHTWVLARIILACNATYYEKKAVQINLDNYDISIEELEKFVSQSEKNVYEIWHDNLINNITIQFTINIINNAMIACGRKRVILLLDDAALTLTKDYMIEFFDIFRSFKTLSISPKASVYPGTTEYGPRFHLKQDGDPFNVWFNPLGDEYSDFIEQLTEKRFTSTEIDENIKEIIKYASFGNPRAFITLLRDYDKNPGKTPQIKFNSIVDIRCKLIKDEYLSIKQKLNQYSSIIDIGWEFFEALINEISEINKKNASEMNGDKQVIIGILENKDQSLQRMIQFLMEAGLLYKLPPVKHGENREYTRYIPHFVFLFQKKSFSKSRGFNPSEIVTYIKRKDCKHPLRKDNVYNILENEVLKNLKLNLPNCSNCGAVRLTENQKFCHFCGYELITKSTFERCMELTVNELPLTDWQKSKIIQETNIKTVKDFVQHINISEELRKPRGIGVKKAERIVNSVNQLIEEFLS